MDLSGVPSRESLDYCRCPLGGIDRFRLRARVGSPW